MSLGIVNSLHHSHVDTGNSRHVVELHLEGSNELCFDLAYQNKISSFQSNRYKEWVKVYFFTVVMG